MEPANRPLGSIFLGCQIVAVPAPPQNRQVGLASFSVVAIPGISAIALPRPTWVEPGVGRGTALTARPFTSASILHGTAAVHGPGLS